MAYDYYNPDKYSQPPQTSSKSSSTGTADTISSAVSSAIQLYQAYMTMKQAPPSVAPNRGSFTIEPTAGRFMEDKKRY